MLTATWLHKCTEKGNKDVRCISILYAKIAAASLSLFGCFLALTVILIYRKYRFFTERLVLYVLIPSVLVAGLSISPDISDDLPCAVVGFLFNSGVLSQRFVMFCIVIHLSMLTYQITFRHMEVAVYFLVWILPFIISLPPWYGSHYGQADVWCWIKGETEWENELRVICAYGWILSLIAIESIIYIVILIKIHNQIQKYEILNGDEEIIAKTRQYKRKIKPLLLYPLLNIMLAIPVTVNRILNWIDPDNPIFPLFLIHSIIYPIWGFCNAMVYLLNKDTMIKLHPYELWCQLRSNFTVITVTVMETSSDVSSNVTQPLLSSQVYHSCGGTMLSCDSDMEASLAVTANSGRSAVFRSCDSF